MASQLRLSDAERDQAAAALADHYAEGRLSADEHAERLDRVWAARTRGDLAPIFRDLPAAGRTPARPASWARQRPGLPPLVPLLVVLVALTVLTHVPFVLLGLGAILFVAARRRRRWAWSHSAPPRW